MDNNRFDNLDNRNNCANNCAQDTDNRQKNNKFRNAQDNNNNKFRNDQNRNEQNFRNDQNNK